MFNSNKKRKNIYYYIIAYRNSEKEIISLFFKYDKDQNNNTIIDSKTYSFTEDNIKIEIITCEIMIDQSQREVIVCFYSCDVSKIGTLYINPNNFTKIEIEKITIEFSGNLKGFKSVVSSDKKNV